MTLSPFIALLLVSVAITSCTSSDGSEREALQPPVGASPDASTSVISAGDTLPTSFQACDADAKAMAGEWVSSAYAAAERLIPGGYQGSVRVICEPERVLVDFLIAEKNRVRPPAVDQNVRRPAYPGPDYHARVHIERKSGRVLRVWAG